MKITPSDIKKCHCYKCGVNHSDPSLTETKQMYRITGVEGKRIDYLIATVDLPLCEDCHTKNKSAKYLPLVLLILLLPAYIYCLATGGLGFWKFLLCTVLTVVISGISWIASEVGVNIAYNLNSDSDYEPVKLMKEYGWQESKPEKTSEFKSGYNEAMHMEMTARIITECECNIEN